MSANRYLDNTLDDGEYPALIQLQKLCLRSARCQQANLDPSQLLALLMLVGLLRSLSVSLI